MPASTYPDLVVSYPPAQRLARSGPKAPARSSSLAPPAAPLAAPPQPRSVASALASAAAARARSVSFSADGLAGGGDVRSRCGSASDGSGSWTPGASSRGGLGRGSSAPALPSLKKKPLVVKKSSADASKHLRQHAIQMGVPPQLKCTYHDLELPVAMAQDPRWSSDLMALSQKMIVSNLEASRCTAGFMPSPNLASPMQLQLSTN
eukprot:TRINITY_DN5496_c1_g1_i1.p1 TRINITY_DN5496_c1_g1~~TRINITY_DN5496_c1_g1_i1.p1  ORF type:complete len:206 (+),score=45.24 TRINITY_DN5496_c1_g1_i1:102-719(+)